MTNLWTLAVLPLCLSACVTEDDSVPTNNSDDGLAEARLPMCRSVAFPTDFYNAGGIGGSAQFEDVSQDPDPSYAGEPMYGYGHGACDYYAVQWAGADWVQASGPNFSEEQCNNTTAYMDVWIQEYWGAPWTKYFSGVGHGQHDGDNCWYGDMYYNLAVNLPGSSVYRVRVAARVEGYDDGSPEADLETRRVYVRAIKQ